MKHIKKRLAVLMMIFFQSTLMADERKDAWYVTSNGESSVMESIYGTLYATLYQAKDGSSNVYFERYSPDHCRENGERLMNHNPVSINGTLVQITQHCRGEWNLFFASTSQGKNYVINQFRNSRSVSVEAEDITFIFSAIGFIEHYNKINRSLNAI